MLPLILRDIRISTPHLHRFAQIAVAHRLFSKIILLCCLFPLLPLHANLLTNSGFESGTITGWADSYGSYTVATSNPHSGVYGGRVSYGSAIRQTVTGLSPSTTYDVTGWIKVTDAGQVVYLGAQNFGGSSVSTSTNTTSWIQKSFSFTTGPSATSATIFIYHSGTGYAYCDDLTLTQPTTNLLVNPGFETGTASGWGTSYGSYAIVTTNPHSGVYGGRVSYGSAIRQTVSGLNPNTTYEVTGWLKVTDSGQAVYLGAQNFGGSSVSTSTNTTTWVQETLSFTTGASATSATIFIYHSGTGYAYCDDLSLTSTSEIAGDPTGAQAERIADCLELLGVNTFSMFDNNGYELRWGGSKGDYTPEGTASAINYITNNSGLVINIREYHRDYSNNTALTPFQIPWIQDVHDATGALFSIAIGAHGGAEDIPGIIDLVTDSINGTNHIRWVEGINEPGNFDQTSAAETADVQEMLYDQIHVITNDVPVVGPSIVINLNLGVPENSLTNYLGSEIQRIIEHSDYNNMHIYPPYAPNGADGSNRDGTLNDFDIGYNTALLNKPVLVTEWHPTLYAKNVGGIIRQNDPSYTAYWGPIFLLEAYWDFGPDGDSYPDWEGFFWFSLFDFHPDITNPKYMPSGMFVSDVNTPKPVAESFRSLYTLTGDQGIDKRSFSPGKLDFSITGLPSPPSGLSLSGGRSALFQNSTGTYFLFIWNEQDTMSSATTPVTVTFNQHTMSHVEEFNITAGNMTPIQSQNNVSSVTVNLDTSLRLLRITY